MGSRKFCMRKLSATNIEKKLFISNTGKDILNFILKISNISPERDVNN